MTTEELIEKLRTEGSDDWSGGVYLVDGELAEMAAARLSELQKVIDDAENDLRSFMTTFVREHFPHVPQWQPLPDLLGMLSQMDNASTIARDYVSRLSEQHQVIASLTLALQKIEQLPPVHGEMEQYRASQEVRLTEQCRFIARDALSKLAED